MELKTGLMVIALITFLGATINGALGYGFSSTTVPVALLFFTNRILNPTLVLIYIIPSMLGYPYGGISNPTNGPGNLPEGLHECRCLVCGIWALKGLNRMRPSGKFTCLWRVGGGSFG